MIAPRYLLLITFCLPILLSAQTFSAMSYNLRYATERDGENAWSKRKADVRKLLQFYAPTFLGTQEGLKHQLDYLDAGLPDYAYVGVGREDGAEGGEYTAIFYDSLRYELMTTETFWLSPTPDKVSTGWDAALPRICTYASFRNLRTMEMVEVFNTHFDHIGEKARLESARLIRDFIEERTSEMSQVILLGDFNSEPHQSPIELLAEVLNDNYESPPDGSQTWRGSYNAKVYGPEGTFNGFDVTKPASRRIDYIFSKNLYALSFRHIDDRRPNNLSPSDHLPVMAVYGMD